MPISLTLVSYVKWIVCVIKEMKCVMCARNAMRYQKWIAFSRSLNHQGIGHESRAEISMLRPMYPSDEE